MQSVTHKSKIVLADYPYHCDIESRLLLSHLSVFEVNVLREIVHHSLKISIEHLADTLHTSMALLIPILDKLEETKLFKRHAYTLIVDKEKRKYYESQLDKFDDDFEPNLEFFQGLLSKVPIHILPAWYSIPRHSNNIFISIVEKYFSTPKIYRQYIQELEFDDPVIPKIIEDIYRSPDFKVPTAELMEKYRLSKEQFEEYILLLEYHFICCLSYQRKGDYWEEVVTPFQEWLDYLLFEKQTQLISIQDKDNIEKLHPQECGFIQDMQKVLKACQHKALSSKASQRLIINYLGGVESILHKLRQLEFINDSQAGIQISDKGALWLSKPLEEQSLLLGKDSLNRLKSFPFSSPLNTIRNIRQIEKSLKRIIGLGWVYLDHFLEGFTHPIGNKEGVLFKNKGKKWRYAIPSYTQEEQQFIKAIIKERFFELGLVSVGIHQNKDCFCLTSLGRSSLH